MCCTGVRSAGPLSVLVRQVVEKGEVDYDKAFFEIKKFYLWTGVSYLTYLRAELCCIMMCKAALDGEIDVINKEAKLFVDRAAKLADDARAENPACLPGNGGFVHDTDYLLLHHDGDKRRRAQSIMQQNTVLFERKHVHERPKSLTEVSLNTYCLGLSFVYICVL